MTTNLQAIVTDYLSIYKSEADQLKLLMEQLSKEAGDQLISRKNLVGHITAGCFVITRDKKVLLLQHKKLGRLLQPGGHVDAEDASPFATALRELEEETGISADLLQRRSLILENEVVPFHIDTHPIPANATKGEDAHYHHDFQYLMLIGDAQDIHMNENESTDWQWIEWSEFKGLESFAVQSAKIEKLL
jgi:8-oxo-dGTP pyrophosphatase MutT (NUDIX family)